MSTRVLREAAAWRLRRAEAGPAERRLSAKGSRVAAAFFFALSLIIGCATHEERGAVPAPTPEPRVVFVVATPTASPVTEIDPTPVPAVAQSTEIVYTLSTPTAIPRPLDVAAIPSLDRQPEPTPGSLREQMTRCLTYTVDVPHDYSAISGRHVVQAEVHAKNSCDFVSFDGGECWFELHSRNKAGQVQAKEVGRFQSPIPTKGETSTVIEISTEWGEKLDATVWWAAGGGKGPQ